LYILVRPRPRFRVATARDVVIGRCLLIPGYVPCGYKAFQIHDTVGKPNPDSEQERYGIILALAIDGKSPMERA